MSKEAKATKVVKGKGEEADVFMVEGCDDFGVKGSRVGTSIEFLAEATEVGLMEIVGFVGLRPPG